MNAIKELELLAVDAHRRGIGWNQFYSEHAAAMKKDQPYDAGRYHRLYQRLMALVCSGDDAGQYPIDVGMAQWDRDDARPGPHDTITQARFDWTKLSGNEVTT
jgi:hypothetical protein